MDLLYMGIGVMIAGIFIYIIYTSDWSTFFK